MINWLLLSLIAARSPDCILVDDDCVFVTEEAYREAVNQFEEQITDARNFAVVILDRPDDILLEQSSAPILCPSSRRWIQTQPWVPMGPAHCKQTRNLQAIQRSIY